MDDLSGVFAYLRPTLELGLQYASEVSQSKRELLLREVDKLNRRLTAPLAASVEGAISFVLATLHLGLSCMAEDLRKRNTSPGGEANRWSMEWREHAIKALELYRSARNLLSADHLSELTKISLLIIEADPELPPELRQSATTLLRAPRQHGQAYAKEERIYQQYLTRCPSPPVLCELVGTRVTTVGEIAGPFAASWPEPLWPCLSAVFRLSIPLDPQGRLVQALGMAIECHLGVLGERANLRLASRRPLPNLSVKIEGPSWDEVGNMHEGLGLLSYHPAGRDEVEVVLCQLGFDPSLFDNQWFLLGYRALLRQFEEAFQGHAQALCLGRPDPFEVGSTEQRGAGADRPVPTGQFSLRVPVLGLLGLVGGALVGFLVARYNPSLPLAWSVVLGAVAGVIFIPPILIGPLLDRLYRVSMECGRARLCWHLSSELQHAAQAAGLAGLAFELLDSEASEEFPCIALTFRALSPLPPGKAHAAGLALRALVGLTLPEAAAHAQGCEPQLFQSIYEVRLGGGLTMPGVEIQGFGHSTGSLQCTSTEEGAVLYVQVGPMMVRATAEEGVDPIMASLADAYRLLGGVPVVL